MLTNTLIPIEATEKDISKINSYARRNVNPEEIYTFSVILCGNDIDRDCEAFTKESLIKMANMFQGKTGILDHDASSKNQIARIYKTSVIKSDEKTLYGEDKYLLKAWAYMVKSPNTNDLILKIDTGIVKEVSISWRKKKKVCSICGNQYNGSCNHILGTKYDGNFCYIKLENPTDAYEWSFVAVPAQTDAGVTKNIKKNYTTNSTNNEFQKQTKALEYYKNRLKSKVIKLSYLNDFMTESTCFKDIINKLSIKELESFVHYFSEKIKEKDFKPTLPHFSSKENSKEKFALKNKDLDFII